MVLLKVSARHNSHSRVKGGLLKVPAMQVVQAVLNQELDLPRGHHVQLLAPDTSLMLPAAHGAHGIIPPAPADPGMQAHTELPLVESE